MSQKDTRLSRRAALMKMAKLPRLLASDEQAHSSSADAEETLASCTSSVACCWQQSKGTDLSRVEQQLASPLKQVEELAQSSRYREPAAALVSQIYQLAGILASHRNHLLAREIFCQQAVLWSKDTEDASLYVAAITKLGLSFHYREQPALALRTYREAWSSLEQASSLTQSSLYMKQAAAYAQIGKRDDAEQSLHLAHQLFPSQPEQDPAFLYADCGYSSLFLWEGLTYLALSQATPDNLDQAELALAWQAFEHCGSTGAHQALSERNRLEIINYQAATAVVQRDLERFTACLTQAAIGAKQLGSEKRRQEAIGVYWKARKAWPQERNIKYLAELFL